MDALQDSWDSRFLDLRSSSLHACCFQRAQFSGSAVHGKNNFCRLNSHQAILSYSLDALSLFSPRSSFIILSIIVPNFISFMLLLLLLFSLAELAVRHL
jgi:hypothetical protein